MFFKLQVFSAVPVLHADILSVCRGHVPSVLYPVLAGKAAVFQSVLSKVDDFGTFKKVEVHAKNSTF